jgi:hypothetical protein
MFFKGTTETSNTQEISKTTKRRLFKPSLFSSYSFQESYINLISNMTQQQAPSYEDYPNESLEPKDQRGLTTQYIFQ